VAENSKIEWCHHTHNIWRGCTKKVLDNGQVASECFHCYAERDYSVKLHGIGWGPQAERVPNSERYRLEEPRKWNRRAARTGIRERVFVNSLSDIWDDHRTVDPQWRMDWARLVEETPCLIWMLLSKRWENAPRMLDEIGWGDGPPANVWYGATAGSQVTADDQIPKIFRCAGAVLYFASCEPLFGELDLKPWLVPHCQACGYSRIDQAINGDHHLCREEIPRGLGWAIAGCESGTKCRPTEISHIRSLRDQAEATEVPFFLKQMMIGGRLVKKPELDGRQWLEVPGFESE